MDIFYHEAKKTLDLCVLGVRILLYIERDEMQNLNFCRQAIKNFNHQEKKYIINDEYGKNLSLAKSMIKNSVKFVLPNGGIIIDDHEIKAIETNEQIRLPYKTIALEFLIDRTDGITERNIILASELDDRIFIQSIVYMPIYNEWQAEHPFSIPDIGFIDRASGSTEIIGGIKHQGSFNGRDVGNSTILLSFINALQCSNIGIEKSAGNPKKNGVKSSLGFDDYNVLTVINTNKQSSLHESCGGSHRSPREHLRRGHIRRLQTGVKIWVNAAVINAGIGAKIHKTYAVK